MSIPLTVALVNSLDIEDISEGGNIMDLKELAKALGLPETATEEEIKKAVEDAVKAAEKLKEMDGKKPGEGDGKPGDGEPKRAEGNSKASCRACPCRASGVLVPSLHQPLPEAFHLSA